MLSPEDARLLTCTGAGTPMGDLMRRYWIPVHQSSALSPGGRVKRVQLLGERLIAYRTPSGTPGVVGEQCPHRGASLYFGRVEEGGMRCAYHGWKFGFDGRCLDMPSEPPESSSFLVRSTSAILAPGDNWVEAVKARIVVPPDRPLSLA